MAPRKPVEAAESESDEEAMPAIITNGSDSEEGEGDSEEDDSEFGSPVVSDFEGDEGGDEEEGGPDEEEEVIEGSDGSGDEDDELDEEEDADADAEDERAMEQAIREMQGEKPGQEADGSDSESDDGERGTSKFRLGKGMRKIEQKEDDDSSEDERESRNTVGNVPLKWYDEEEHIGYDKSGKKIVKRERKDQLDEFLERTDNKQLWRTVRDEYNDEDIVLSKEEMQMVQRIRKGQFPDLAVNPYPDYIEWMKYDDHIHPLSSAPEPKRRFIPSKWEAKKVVKLVRAMRRGWLKLDKPKEEEKTYLMWTDDTNQMSEKTANGLSYIPAPKPQLPGHEESYNPPAEYVPTEEEVAAYEMMEPHERPKFVPKSFAAMRQVPAYDKFVHERFERCLDLYLCPRTRKKRVMMDPEALLPKLPKPRDLKPFPTWNCILFEGHTDKVWSVSVDPSGQWLASGGQDGMLRLWEVRTGRCQKVWDLGGPVKSVAWSPNADVRIVGACTESRLLLLPAGVGGLDIQEATRAALDPQQSGTAQSSGLATWARWEGAGAHGALAGLEVQQKFPIKSVTWHHRGDYLATVAPTGGSASVLVHQLSKQASQNPFRKNKGRVVSVLFHPNKPFFFVATQHHVRVYNLAKQTLAKKLLCGTTSVSSMAVHPGGDNLIIGALDRKLAWFDMDLSTKPYKTIQSHEHALQAVSFHRRYPLFATASDDATVHVFHGMVYSDLMQNPLIVPVKILRGHSINDHQGVLDIVFHPTQPWVFTAGADKTIRLFCN